eukprot:GILI01009988.1.p1 GENE.GILI01009988.1~~GILI01009988.1.p1  ORF type:complete len:277 (+),score=72.87 GILI01009988.1:90-920(+)
MGLPAFIRAPVTVYNMAMMFAGWAVADLLQAIAISATYFFVSKETRSDICGSLFRHVNHVFAVVLNPFWRVKVLRRMPVLPPGPGPVLVMNHLSNADPFVCSGAVLPVEMKWVCKGEVANLPLGGWGIKNNGDLAVHFTTEKEGWGTVKGSVSTMMATARSYINRGRGVAVFPEGIRSFDPNGPLNEFKLGFFMLAIETGAPVIPLAMTGSDRAWPRKSWMMDVATVYITIGDPIPSQGETAESLRDKAVAAISAMRDTHPDRAAYLLKQKNAKKD